jgi:hypothetical protein
MEIVLVVGFGCLLIGFVLGHALAKREWMR